MIYRPTANHGPPWWWARLRTGILSVVAASACGLLVGTTAAGLTTSRIPDRVDRAPVKISTFGDSYTIGLGSSPGRDGYRTELSRLLVMAGQPHTYGAGGYRAGETIQYLLANVDGWLAVDQPDVVLLSIGTNNAAQPNMANFESLYIQLVNRILAFSPTIRVVVGQVFYANGPYAKDLVKVNEAAIHAAWWETTAGRSRPAGRVWLADLSVIHVCQAYDGVHLRDSGYDMMARIWYQKVAELLGLTRPVYRDHTPAQRRPGYERTPVVQCRRRRCGKPC